MRTAITLAALAIFCSLFAAESSAQFGGSLEVRQFSKDPVAITYMRGVTPMTMQEYVTDLSSRLEIGKRAIEQFSRQPMKEMTTEAEEPVMGQLTYMVQTLTIPSFESVTFQQVVDIDDAKRMVNARKKQFGDSATLEINGDNFVLTNSWSWKNEIPEGTEPPEVNYPENSPIKRTTSIIEEDGKRYQETVQTYTMQFRYHDEFLFESNAAELLEIELPAADEIMSGVDGSSDLGAKIYMDRVPMGIKQLGWNMMNSTVSTQLQQRDDEDVTDFELRQSGGQYGLFVLKTLLFDVDFGDGWARFASEGQPVHGEFLLRARRNSGFTKWLDDLSSARSRFAPLLRDDAAATVHLCLNLPEDARNILPAAGRWMEKNIAEHSKADAEALSAIGGIAETLTGISEHGNIELMIKTGWSEASDGVIYGGLQVDDHPQLLQNLYNLITDDSIAPPQAEQMLSLVEKDGVQMIEGLIPPLPKDDIPVKITHVYFAHENSRLWFAAGSENSYRMIQQSIDRCNGSTRAFKTSLFSAHVDVDQWRSYPQDDPTGIAALPNWLDTTSLLPGMIMPFGGSNREKLDPLMDRVFALGGDTHGRFTIDVDESGLLASAELGEALANYYAARMISMVDRQMQRSIESQEEARRRNEELRKQAEERQKQQSAK